MENRPQNENGNTLQGRSEAKPVRLRVAARVGRVNEYTEMLWHRLHEVGMGVDVGGLRMGTGDVVAS